MSENILTQNDLLLNKLLLYYKENNNLTTMLNIINGESKISLRIVDWFATNYSKKNYTVYNISKNNKTERFKVYNDYKLKLKAYSKKRFDPFCRWERINIPYENNNCIQTTIGQLNFFKWALENNVIKYIEDNYKIIDQDMNNRNSSSKNKNYSLSSNSSNDSEISNDSDLSLESNNSMKSNNSSNFATGEHGAFYNSANKTRKKREELSANASKSVKKEFINTVLLFN